jgi:hypothetical protein
VPQERRKEHIMDERNDMQATLGATDRRHTILIIGISRGIGRGLAAEYFRSAGGLPFVNAQNEVVPW